MVAPKTAMLIRVAPSPVSASRKPMAPGTIRAIHGVLRPLVTARSLGRYPALERANVWREYATLMEKKLAIRPASPARLTKVTSALVPPEASVSARGNTDGA